MMMHRVLLQFLISRLQRRRLNPPSASSSSSLPPATTTLYEIKNILVEAISEITSTPPISSRKSSRMTTMMMHLCLCVCVCCSL